MAELRWGHHRAAILSGWTVVDATWTATIEILNAFAVEQRPLTIVVPSKGIWDVERLEIVDATCTATVRPHKEPSHGEQSGGAAGDRAAAVIGR
jgi:hypothetical protein